MMTAATSPELPLTWLMLRTTGIVALALLSLSTVLGIVSPVLRSPTRRFVAISLHRSTGATGLLLLVSHVILAVLDSYVRIPPLAVLVPGVSIWQPLWIGVGAVALDLIILLVITTLTRYQAPRLWRRMHLAAYAAVLLAWGHALAVGTDSGDLPVRITALVGLGAAVAALHFRRIRSTAAQALERPPTRTKEYA